MNPDISPEERLFNVIKTGRKPVRLESAGGMATIEPPMASFFSNIDLPKINNGLLACLAILVFLAVGLFFNKRELSLQKLSELPLDNVLPARSETVEPYQPVGVYVQQVKKRDIFRPVTAESAAAGDSLAATNKDFVLSGIYMGPVPQAIITVKPEQKAYFLKEGEDIKGYKVKSIQKNKVILQRGDEEIELL